MYKPLPQNLTLGESEIHDIGLFAKKDIKRGHNFGISHIQIGKELIRTPLGGFINHSDKPNCVKVESVTRQRVTPLYDHDFTKWDLVTIKDIEVGEELTVSYTFYNIKKDFLDEAEKEKKELEESYQESVRQTKERKTTSEQAQDELEPITSPMSDE